MATGGEAAAEEGEGEEEVDDVVWLEPPRLTIDLALSQLREVGQQRDEKSSEVRRKWRVLVPDSARLAVVLPWTSEK
jgi:hypothetical protein